MSDKKNYPMVLEMDVIGKLIKDAEMKESKNGKPYTNLVISAPMYVGEGKGYNGSKYDSLLVKVTAFNETAVRIKSLKKDDYIWVHNGSLQVGAYVDKNGTAKADVSVTANSITVLQGETTSVKAATNTASSSLNIEIDEDSIPF